MDHAALLLSFCLLCLYASLLELLIQRLDVSFQVVNLGSFSIRRSTRETQIHGFLTLTPLIVKLHKLT